MRIAEHIASIECKHRRRGPDPPCQRCITSAERKITVAPAGALDLVARHFSEGCEPTALCYIEALDLLTKLRPYLALDD